jgi:hypothetical protein
MASAAIVQPVYHTFARRQPKCGSCGGYSGSGGLVAATVHWHCWSAVVYRGVTGGVARAQAR